MLLFLSIENVEGNEWLEGFWWGNDVEMWKSRLNQVWPSINLMVLPKAINTHTDIAHYKLILQEITMTSHNGETRQLNQDKNKWNPRTVIFGCFFPTQLL